MATVDEKAASLAFRHEYNLTAATAEERADAVQSTAFGTHFTDHMALVDWTSSTGWADPRIVPLGPLRLHPAAAVLHYGQEIFEGLKAYRHPDGRIVTFRPDFHAERMRRSADRLALPRVPRGLFNDSISALVSADREWVPCEPGQSLYVRPFLIATEAFLGVRPAEHAVYGVIASTARAYFTATEEGVSLWLSTTHSRAGRGGTGAAKCGGNYASSLLAQQEARQNGCEQVLFTDAATGTWVEEAGSMNIFFAFADGTIVTPPTDGTILEGATRDSILRLAVEFGHRIEERPISVEEWMVATKAGQLLEVFATGTAAVVTPVKRLVSRDHVIPTATTGLGPVAERLRAELVGIHHGSRPDRFDWLREVS
ncbi:MAG: branched-chain amino acid aminotransferase [Nocardioidaceae bacterium]|jgi:branched-chain amino acid aminotransferase|nr:branched-chain amino acid aminotransferase [Nocardioidaceae bacterium]